MSASELAVRAPDWIRSEVADAGFRRVASGHGAYSVDVEPGLYSVWFELGGASEYVDVAVPHGAQSISVSAPTFAFSTSAPLSGTATSHEWHCYPAEELSKSKPRMLGSGASILVFARQVAAAERPEPERSHDPRRHYLEHPSDWPPTNPARGLSLRRLDGTLLVDLSHADVVESEHRAGCHVEVKPGTYCLRSETSSGHWDLPVIAMKGWHTRVFVLARRFEDELLPDLATAVISHSPEAAFKHDDQLRHLEAQFQEALRANRQVPHTSALLDRYWREIVAQAPVLGLCLAHIGLRTGDASREQLVRLAKALRSQLGLHPDVLALQLLLDPGAAVGTIEAPPMMAASWRALVAASYVQPGLVPARSPIDAIAEATSVAAPWVIWSSMEAVILEDEAADALSHVRVCRGSQTISPEWVDELALMPASILLALGTGKDWTLQTLGSTLGLPQCSMIRVTSRLCRAVLGRVGSRDLEGIIGSLAAGDASSLAAAASRVVAVDDGRQASRYALLAGRFTDVVHEKKRFLERALELDPANQEAFADLLALMRASGRVVSFAADTYRRVATTGNAALLAQAGDINAEVGNVDFAMQAWRRALEVTDYGDRDSFERLTLLLADQGRHGELLQTLYRHAGARGALREEQARSLFRAGTVLQHSMADPKAALAAFLKALEMGADPRATYTALADAYAEVGQWWEARNSLARLRELSPPAERPRIDRQVAAMTAVMEGKSVPDPDYEARRGFDAQFIPGGRFEAPQLQGVTELRYQHFSVVLYPGLHTPVMAMANVRALRPAGRSPLSAQTQFVDPRTDWRAQPAPDEGVGHTLLVDPEMIAWGSLRNASRAALDALHDTNRLPVHPDFDAAASLWRELVPFALERGVSEVTVFAGPVLGEPLLLASNVPVPLRHWKVLVWRGGGLRCAAFVIDQFDLFRRGTPPAQLPVRRVRIREISVLTGLEFAGAFLAGDVTKEDVGFEVVSLDAALGTVLGGNSKR